MEFFLDVKNNFNSISRRTVSSIPKTYLQLLVTSMIGLYVARKLLEPIFFKLGCYLGKHKGNNWVKENTPRIEKFKGLFFKMLCHSLLTIWAYKLFKDEDWFVYGENMHIAVNFFDRPISYQHYLYYVIQTAFHLQAFIYVFFEKRNSSEFAKMFVHHVATALMLLGSTYVGEVRFGSVVLFVHDISDIPGYIAKLFNCVKWNIYAFVFFLTTCAYWGYWRLYFYSFRICYPSIIYNYKAFDNKYVIIWNGSLMVSLSILHFIWYSTFMSIIWNVISKNVYEDKTEEFEKK